MNNSFKYPGIAHVRKFAPPQYASYKRYKPILREEFGERCVYCRASSRLKGDEAFGVDHYRPQKHFPHLANEYLNLFYSCNHCNSLKSAFWPSAGQLRDGRFIPNPCEHVMLDHLRYHGAVVVKVSGAGAFTIELLDLNEPRLVEWRELVIVAADAVRSRLRLARQELQEVKKRLPSPDPVIAHTARTLRSVAEENVAKLEAALAKLEAA